VPGDVGLHVGEPHGLEVEVSLGRQPPTPARAISARAWSPNSSQSGPSWETQSPVRTGPSIPSYSVAHRRLRAGVRLGAAQPPRGHRGRVTLALRVPLSVREPPRPAPSAEASPPARDARGRTARRSRPGRAFVAGVGVLGTYQQDLRMRRHLLERGRERNRAAGADCLRGLSVGVREGALRCSERPACGATATPGAGGSALASIRAPQTRSERRCSSRASRACSALAGCAGSASRGAAGTSAEGDSRTDGASMPSTEMAGLIRRVGSVRQGSDGNRACGRTPGGVGRAGGEPGQPRALCLTGRRRGGARRPVSSPVVIRVPRDAEHVPARPEAAARVARPPSEAWSTLVRVAELPLRSGAFQHGGEIPRRHSCEGQDVSPALAWSAPPPGT
jgi:hypothetical protein